MPLDIRTAGLEKSATDGRWIPTSRGGEMCVARWNNPKYRLLQSKLQQDFRKARPGKKRIKGTYTPPEVAEEMNFELVVKTILLDWKDFANGAEEFPCTEANKRVLLAREDMHWLMEEIQQASMDDEAFFREQQEEDQGNSVTVSAGNSSGGSLPNGLNS